MSTDSLAELRDLEWLDPWEPIAGSASGLEEELTRELNPAHILFERKAVAVARRLDQDDVLFWLPDGPATLAVVHLTWTGRRELSADWPSTVLYPTVAEWVEQGMRLDHADCHGSDGRST